VLALGGAVAGLIVAYALVKGIVALAPADVPRLDQARVNGVVLTFAFVVAGVTSILIGLVPAMRSASPALQQALREGGRGVGTSATRDRLRALLVSAEVAMAMTLLTGSGLLIRTAWRLQHVDPGFTPSHVMTARVLLPATRYVDAAHITRTFEQIRDAAAHVPGVERVALTSVVPLSGDILSSRIVAEGKPLTDNDAVAVDIRYASPEYFATMGMPLEDGRDFERIDNATVPSVAIISASLAQRLWPGERAVGKRIDAMRERRDTPNWLTVVGVVPDVHHTGLGLPPTPTLYMPFMQTAPGMWTATGRSMVMVSRTTPEPATVLKGLQRAVMTVDPALPLVDAHPMEYWLAESLARARFNTLLLVTLGTLALLLASVGVYGVVGFFVSQRTREIGVRIALGATPTDIWRLVLGRGLRPIVFGVIAGSVLSLATARLLREQLYGVRAEDPVTLVAVVAMLMVVALIATFVPARRAMRVRPVVALAAE
jgi:predicted permease